MMFEALTKQLPFAGSPIVVASLIRDQRAPSARSVRPDLSKTLDSILAKCLEPDPARRYQSAGELIRDLQSWLDGGQVLIAKQARWSPWWLATSALVSVSLVGAFASYSIWGSHSTPFTGASLLPNMDSNNSSGIHSGRSEKSAEAVHSALRTWISTSEPKHLIAWTQAIADHSGAASQALELSRNDAFAAKSTSWQWHLASMIAFPERESLQSQKSVLTIGFYDALNRGDEREWSQALSSTNVEIVDALEQQLREESNSNRRARLIRILTLMHGMPDFEHRVLRLLKDAANEELSDIFNAIHTSLPRFSEIVPSELKRIRPEKFPDAPFEPSFPAKELGRLTVAAMMLDEWGWVDDILDYASDPRARTHFLLSFPYSNNHVDPLLNRYRDSLNEWHITALMSCIESYPSVRWQEETLDQCVIFLCDVYAHHPSAGAHMQSKAILKAWDKEHLIASIEKQGNFSEIRDDRNWYTNSLGIPMSIVRGPRSYWFGRTKSEIDASYEPELHKKTLEFTFAFSSELITNAQFNAMVAGPEANVPEGEEDLPRRIPHSHLLNEFCENLTAYEGLTQEQSYRLFNVWEWECAARASTSTSYWFGNVEDWKTDPTTSLPLTNPIGFQNNKIVDVGEWTTTTYRDMVPGVAPEFAINGIIKGGFHVGGQKPHPTNSLRPYPTNGTYPYCIRVLRNLD